MRVRGVVKLICKHCYMVKRGKRRYVYCKVTPKHKQRQGFHTLIQATSRNEGLYIPQCREIGSMPSSDIFINTSESQFFKYRPVLGLAPLVVNAFTSQSTSDSSCDMRSEDVS